MTLFLLNRLNSTLLSNLIIKHLIVYFHFIILIDKIRSLFVELFIVKQIKSAHGFPMSTLLKTGSVRR